MPRLLFVLSLLFIFSCDDPVSSSNPLPTKLYVCDQGSDRVVILDASTDNLSQLDAIDINFSDDQNPEIPHFIAIDETHGYWFVTAFQSGFVGMYDLDQDTLIHAIDLGSGSAPALLAVDEDNQMLYVSKMMTQGIMQGGDDELGALDYSSGQLVDAGSISLVDEEDNLSFPEPHAISIALEPPRGLNLVTASFTADWFSMIKLDAEEGEIDPQPYPFNYEDTAVIVKNELFPLSVTQKDNYLFFSCRGSVDSGINGQVQSWSVISTTKKDTFSFGTSRPWHIIASPTESEIFVVLSGDSETSSSAGLSCLTYDEDGKLSEKWPIITDSDFDTLHGVTVSSDGTRVYVSSRGNGFIHVIDALSGTLLNTVEGIGMDMEMEMGSLSGIAIIQ